jgi:hypothetical protein
LIKFLDKFYNKLELPWVQLICYDEGKIPHVEDLRGSFWWRDVLKQVDNFRGVVIAKLGRGDTFFFGLTTVPRLVGRKADPRPHRIVLHALLKPAASQSSLDASLPRGIKCHRLECTRGFLYLSWNYHVWLLNGSIQPVKRMFPRLYSIAPKENVDFNEVYALDDKSTLFCRPMYVQEFHEF